MSNHVSPETARGANLAEAGLSKEQLAEWRRQQDKSYWYERAEELTAERNRLIVDSTALRAQVARLREDAEKLRSRWEDGPEYLRRRAKLETLATAAQEWAMAEEADIMSISESTRVRSWRCATATALFTAVAALEARP